MYAAVVGGGRVIRTNRDLLDHWGMAMYMLKEDIPQCMIQGHGSLGLTTQKPYFTLLYRRPLKVPRATWGSAVALAVGGRGGNSRRAGYPIEVPDGEEMTRPGGRIH